MNSWVIPFARISFANHGKTGTAPEMSMFVAQTFLIKRTSSQRISSTNNERLIHRHCALS